MNLNEFTIKDLFAMAIENEVDFEVWHGVTTHKDRSVRRHIRLAPSGCPAVLITLGDRKHGERGSTINVEGHPRLNVQFQDVYDVVYAHQSTNHWQRDFQVAQDTNAAKPVNLTALKPDTATIPARTVKIIGEELVQPDPENPYRYTLTAHNYGTISSGEVVAMEDTVVDIQLPAVDPKPFLGEDGRRWSQFDLEVNERGRHQETYKFAPRDMKNFHIDHPGDYRFEGVYHYPNRISEITDLS